MKFLALKEALESVLPPPEPPKSDPPELPSIPFFSPDEKKQRMVGGDVLYTPVNKQAALVVAKAPWWAKPPAGPSCGSPIAQVETITPPRIERRKKKAMSQNATVHKINNPAIAPGTTEGKKSNDEFNCEIASEAVKRAERSIDQVAILVEKAKDARAALDIMCDYWKAEWMDFMEQGDERLKQFRMFRMAFDTETKVLMASMREVRQFFLDKNHDGEVQRLKEFVDLCERLQKLKSSGFLDTVADTLIKLT